MAGGTYDSVRLATCTDGQGGGTSHPIDYTAGVAGEASIIGSTYVTGPNAAALVSIDTSGGSGERPARTAPPQHTKLPQRTPRGGGSAAPITVKGRPGLPAVSTCR